MRALVIGGTHFVGRHIVEVLLEAGYEVSVLNRGVSPDELPVEVERLRADRTAPDQVVSALKGRSFDAVVDCIAFQKEDVTTMVGIFKGRIDRYVLISSVSVYRPADVFPIEETFPVHTRSSWAYAQQKVDCEDALFTAGRQFGFPGVVIRPAYVYGPYNSNPNWELKMFARMLSGRPVMIPGDGRFIFHHTHGRDLAEAALAALRRPESVGNAYNIAGREVASANGYVAIVAAAIGCETKIVHVPADLDREAASEIFPYQPRPTQIYSINRASRDLHWSRYLDTHMYDFQHEDSIFASL